uniref:S-protein homolog n=1 Tax=Kalanchoe fedtschenkoi TaxID=63787 RepID=A0A7N0TAY3_KALFE
MLLMTLSICSLLLSSNADRNTRLLWGKTIVRIFNKSEMQADMVVQCWSSEDDLGPHTVKFNQSYEFPFKVNWSGSTKFLCKVKFGNGDWKYWYGFRYWRDDEVGHLVGWNVNETRPCRSDGACMSYN